MTRPSLHDIRRLTLELRAAELTAKRTGTTDDLSRVIASKRALDEAKAAMIGRVGIGQKRVP